MVNGAFLPNNLNHFTEQNAANDNLMLFILNYEMDNDSSSFAF